MYVALFWGDCPNFHWHYDCNHVCVNICPYMYMYTRTEVTWSPYQNVRGEDGSEYIAVSTVHEAFVLDTCSQLYRHICTCTHIPLVTENNAYTRERLSLHKQYRVTWHSIELISYSIAAIDYYVVYMHADTCTKSSKN